MVFSTSSESNRHKDLKENLRAVTIKLASQQGLRESAQNRQSDLTSEITNLNVKLDNFKLIEAYLAQFADERQAQVYRQIEHTVTEGLRTVFNEDLKLEITTKMVGARSETAFSIVSKTDEGEMSTGIMDARGGGVAAIVGFLVQAVLVLLTPGMRPLLVLDESFRAVSAEYQAPLGEFIKDLCEKTGLQVVLVTHQPTIVEFADTAYAFSQTKGKTKITKLT